MKPMNFGGLCWKVDIFFGKRQNVIEKVKIVQPLKNANLVTRYLSAAKMMIVQNGITYDHIT
jgi:hypothetical protein